MRVTSQHWEEFLVVSERHPSLITSKFNGAQGKAEGNALWTSVATKLNALGFGEKSVAEWRRAVTDWKSKVKAKASKIRVSYNKTGGGPVDTTPLTPLEEKLLTLMGKKGFEGDEGIKELGIMALKRPASTTKPDDATNCNFYKQASVPSSAETSKLASAVSAAHKYDFCQIFENTLQDLTNVNAPSASSKPRDEAHEQQPSEYHDYCVKKKMISQSSNEVTPNANKHRYKRLKTTSIPRVSKHLQDMTSESVTLLKNIDRNTSRIADSFEKLVKHFVEE